MICTGCKLCDASHSPAKYTFKRVPRTQALMSAIEAVQRSSAQTGEAGTIAQDIPLLVFEIVAMYLRRGFPAP